MIVLSLIKSKSTFMREKLELEETTDYHESLVSARIVQQGLLPKGRHFERLFKDSFVTYIPQNFISGDFYWVGRKHDMRYLVVGDCTGHGISASLLSVLALNLFEYAIMNKGIKKTNKILQEVDNRFIESFNDSSHDIYDNPWIDLSIVCIDEGAQTLYFSSANRKLLKVSTVKKQTLHRGSSYLIGGWQIENERTFESIPIKYEEGDVIFLGSDGFQDQIGGPKDKTYKSKKLHKFLATSSHLPMNILKKDLEEEFEIWRGNEPQTDDICVVGVRL